MYFHGVMLLKMNEQQFKRWMTAKTRQYIWLIMRRDPNRVKITFSKSFKRPFVESHGLCSKESKHIYYRTDYVHRWDCNIDILEKLVIHEVCHLKYMGHDSAFFTEYKKWSGDDFIGRWCEGRIDDGDFTSHIVGLPNVGRK